MEHSRNIGANSGPPLLTVGPSNPTGTLQNLPFYSALDATRTFDIFRMIPFILKNGKEGRRLFTHDSLVSEMTYL